MLQEFDMKLPIANILTVSRVLVLIPYVILFYIPGSLANWIAVWLYGYACVTDYLDGLAARLRNEESPFGRFLDPIADKILIVTTLLMLAGTGRIHGISLIPAVIILCRELLISGLREFLSDVKISVPVTVLAKWKTALQMVSLGIILADEANDVFFCLHEIGFVMFWTAAILTLITGYEYLKASYTHLSFSKS